MPKISEDIKNERKENIINHAFQLFSEKGYSGTTMDDIVKASGMSKGGIYNYFKSKEEIFFYIADKPFKIRHELLNKNLDNLSNAYRLKLYIEETLKRTFKEDFIKYARFIFEFWSVLSRDNSVGKIAKERYKMFYEDLAKILEDGKSTGEFRGDLDVEATCYIILSSLDGAAFFYSVMGVHTPDNIVENYVSMIMSKVTCHKL